MLLCIKSKYARKHRQFIKCNFLIKKKRREKEMKTYFLWLLKEKKNKEANNM